jgi:hypothetical protein
MTFHLGSNAILDIGDLRQITKQELFLFLMSEKVDRIKPRKMRTPLRLGNISVVHGAAPMEKAKNRGRKKPAVWQQEFNGAMALYEQDFYPNAILKLHKMQVKYPWVNDCGRPDFYLARSFEELNEPGQAFDAYERVIERAGGCDSPDAEERLRFARKAVDRLNEIR